MNLNVLNSDPSQLQANQAGVGLSMIADQQKLISEEDQREDFLNYTRAELTQLVAEKFGLTKYRATQVFEWVYRFKILDPDLMTNIKKDDREQLKKIFKFKLPEIATRQISADGTRKYLFRLEQGDLIESVMIKQPKRMTICVSSQVGCAMGCKFCRTGTMGLKRNLSVSEIIQQFMGVIEDAKNFDDMFTNVVFMGMGEPLHNVTNVCKAIEILNDEHGLNISGRKITVSTVGLVPGIRKFKASAAKACLAISLNSTSDKVRSSIMPMNDHYSIDDLISVVNELFIKKRELVTIEYVMLEDVNIFEEDIKRLKKIMHKMPAKLNLIPYNSNTGLGFKSPSFEKVAHWQRELSAAGIVTNVRWSKGQDINAACGQLATESKKK